MAKKYKEDTELVHLGRAPEDYFGVVNSPVAKASSIIYDCYEDYESSDYKYARSGTPLSMKLEQAMTKLEGGYNAIMAPSGLTAITTALLAFLKAGDHLLMTDSVYPPTRSFCDNILARLGIETTYYDPAKPIDTQIKSNTTVIYMESPGSAIFDVIDVKAVVAAAKKKNILTIFDDSWSGGILYKPFAHGVDVIVQSLTKYIGGHSDIMLGIVIAANEKTYRKLKDTTEDLGICAGSDECFLALRGLRTAKLRLDQHQKNATQVAQWLQKRPEVTRVYYPALPGHPTHTLWKRDFCGANGLISVLLKEEDQKKVGAFVDALKLFPVANSWGGYETLLQPQNLDNRKVAVWKEKGTLLRIHIGIENPDDLIADLEQGFKHL